LQGVWGGGQRREGSEAKSLPLGKGTRGVRQRKGVPETRKKTSVGVEGRGRRKNWSPGTDP